MKKTQSLWYTRKQGEIKGPFTQAIITNNIILGRLTMHDQVSLDQSQWQLIVNVYQLHPQTQGEEKRKAQKQLDERNGFDRRDGQPPSPQHQARRSSDRRSQENAEDIQHRQFHTTIMQRFRQQKQHFFWPLVFTFSLLFSALILAISFPKQLPVPLPNCVLPATAGVNWNNCLKAKLDLQDHDLTEIQLRNSQLIGSNLMNTDLSGADIAYADLRFTNLSYSDLNSAILLGSSLEKADLSFADLTNANLSYADLRGVNFGGVRLKNTRFDNAIWPTGQLCAVNSIDRCITVTK